MNAAEFRQGKAFWQQKSVHNSSSILLGFLGKYRLPPYRPRKDHDVFKMYEQTQGSGQMDEQRYTYVAGCGTYAEY